MFTKLLTRSLAVLCALAAVQGCTGTDSPTELRQAPRVPTYEVNDTTTVPPPPENSTQGDTLCRDGGTVGSGGGRTCDPA